MPGLEGYTPADLARLASIQTNGGRTKPVVRERRSGLRMVRVVRKQTDSGAHSVVRDYTDERGEHRDVIVQPRIVRGYGGVR